MLKKTIKYTDFDGNEVSEDFYFNLTKAEVAEMELAQTTLGADGSATGGMKSMLESIVASGSGKRIIDVFKEILSKSYGIRSEDGKRFIKTPRLFEEFTQTAAYSEFFMQLVTEADAAAEFIKGVLPAELSTPSDKPAAPVDSQTPENY